MADNIPILGVCFSGKRLLYAVSKPDADVGEVFQVGCIDYSFDVLEAFVNQDSEMFSGIYNAIGRLKNEYDIHEMRILTLPEEECWTIFPKTVYDAQEDLEAHISAVTHGMEDKRADPEWFTLSNRDYKMAAFRSEIYLQSLNKLTNDASQVHYYSDFEIGTRWIDHSKSTGSFLTVSCHKNLISISSFILGKLRAATYINFQDINDLPYFWLQNTNNLTWLNGLYDQILVYGYESYKVVEMLHPFWEDNAEIVTMDSLEKMQVKANEKTYSFNLDEAFPAIMLALGSNSED
ncbi:MAG: hypothetical protein WD267_10725 [Balneolales bacterium]